MSSDIRELYNMVSESDDKSALNEIIDRQQQGKALRFYPKGRKGIDDIGFVPVLVAHDDGVTVIRSGRPNDDVKLTEEQSMFWITNVSMCAISAVKWHLDRGAKCVDSAEERISDLVLDLADDDFDCSITPSSSKNEGLLSILPRGSNSWFLDFDDCSKLVASICELCKIKGWDYRAKATEQQLLVIDAMLDRF